MRLFSSIVAVLAVTSYAVGADVNEGLFDGTKVVELTTQDWDEYKAKNSKFMVAFYAPWCGHCKKLKEEYIIAAEDLLFSAPLTAVNCDAADAKQLCTDYDIKGFPTLKWHDDGVMTEYDGGRTQGAISTFVTGKAGTTNIDHVDLKTLRVKQLRKILKDRGFECKGCTEKHEYIARVNEIKNLKPPEKKKKKTFKSSLKNGRTVAQERRYKEAKKVADEGWEGGNGAVTHLVDDEYAEYTKKNENHFIMFYAPWCGHCKTFKPELVGASEELKDEFPIAAIDCVTNPETCETHGAKSYPTLKLFLGQRSFGYNGGRNSKDLVDWLRKKVTSDGEVEPYTNPELWEDNGNVYHVGDDHWKEFKKEHANMLVMFYAPWCGHCKAAKPAFARASETLQGVADVVAVDCTEHTDTCGEYGVNGYPQIKFISASKKKAVDFNGDRNESKLVEFVQAQIELLSGGKSGAKEEL